MRRRGELVEVWCSIRQGRQLPLRHFSEVGKRDRRKVATQLLPSADLYEEIEKCFVALYKAADGSLRRRDVFMTVHACALLVSSKF